MPPATLATREAARAASPAADAPAVALLDAELTDDDLEAVVGGLARIVPPAFQHPAQAAA